MHCHLGMDPFLLPACIEREGNSCIASSNFLHRSEPPLARLFSERQSFARHRHKEANEGSGDFTGEMACSIVVFGRDCPVSPTYLCTMRSATP